MCLFVFFLTAWFMVDVFVWLKTCRARLAGSGTLVGGFKQSDEVVAWMQLEGQRFRLGVWYCRVLQGMCPPFFVGCAW